MKVYILFQTDRWKTNSSRVFFGAFDSFEKANQAAKENDLYTSEAAVDIVEVELNQFQ